MTVYLVGAGPGDPGLLTVRGAELLAVADVVLYDRLVDRSLLSLAPPGAELVDVGKATAGEARQEQINGLLVRHGRAERTVVRLKGGDPFVFGRGGEEAEALDAAGVPWEVVPGVTSAVAAPAAAGVPVTHRSLSTSVTVVTGHVGEVTAPGGVDWESLGRAGGTLVVLMGMANRAEIARRLMAAGRPGSTPVAVIEWATTPHQRSERTTLDELGDVTLGSPAVIVVGAVAGLALRAPPPRPLAGATVVVTRARQQAGGLAEGLASAGARVLEVPVIEIAGPADGGAALRRAAETVGGYDWVAFTSANAVARFVPLLRDARALAGVGVAAVGDATAAALAGRGIAADLCGEPATADGLVAVFPSPAGAGRVLFPRAEEARDALPVGLRAKGWEVDEVIAYRTLPAPAPADPVVEALAAADAVTFTSPSTVRSYRALRTAAGQPLPLPPVVACIGPVTAAAARKAGLEVAVEAAAPSADALVAALAARLGHPAP